MSLLAKVALKSAMGATVAVLLAEERIFGCSGLRKRCHRIAPQVSFERRSVHLRLTARGSRPDRMFLVYQVNAGYDAASQARALILLRTRVSTPKP